MAIDIATETIVGLTEATKILPKVNGKRPAISTLQRWCPKGLRGVQLEYIRVGRGIATSREALNRFFSALADVDKPPAYLGTPVPRERREREENPAAHQRDVVESHRRLAIPILTDVGRRVRGAAGCARRAPGWHLTGR